MINNMSLKTISLEDSTGSGQISGGWLYESSNGYVHILQRQDNTTIIFDINSDKLASKYQPLISSTNKLDSSLISGFGSTTMLSNFFVYEFKYRAGYEFKYIFRK